MSSDGRTLASQVRKLARNAVALATGGLIAQLSFTFLEILVARRLGADTYGVFVTAYAWTTLASLVAGLGTSFWTIQEGSRRQEQLPTLFGSGLTVSLAMFGLLFGLLAAVAYTFVSNPILAFLLVILPYGLVLALQNVLVAVYSTFQEMHVAAFFQSLAPVTILAIYLVLAAGGLTLADVGLAYVAGGFAVTGWWLLVTLRRVRPRVSLSRIRETLRSSYQYALTSVLGQVYFRVDVIMLSALAGVHEAGIYAAGLKLLELVYKVAILSQRVFAPAIFKASHAPGKSFQVFASMLTRFLAVAGLLAGVLTFVLAEDLILWLFGERYVESVPVLQMLAGVMVARCMIVALQLLLSSIDLHFQRTKGLFIALVAHVAANAILIPQFGARGAAVAALFSSTSLVLLYAVYSAGRREFNFRRWLLLPSALAATVTMATVFAEVDALVRATVAVLVFLSALVGLGFVHRDEIRFVLRSVLPNNAK